MRDLAYGRDSYQKAAKRRVAQNVDFKDNLEEFGKKVKRGKRNLQSKGEMGLFYLKHGKELYERDKRHKGALNTEKKNPLRLPTKKPIKPPKIWKNEGTLDYKNQAIRNYQRDEWGRPGKKPRYF